MPLEGSDLGKWSAGDTVGRYRLRRKLGAGAFAEVWLALESNSLGFEKEVALKLLKAADDEKQKTDLLREARLSAVLRPPNVVDVLSVDEAEGALAVAMEVVDGGTLRDLIDRVALAEADFPLSVVVDLGSGIVRGLQHAHAAKDPQGRPLSIIHRDLKPENVLVDATGAPKLTDFGIAKVLGEGTATDVGMMKGTAAYVAPEIWKGGRDFQPRVDLFALGCILYELVTLRRLFQGPIQSIFGQVALRTAAEEVAAVSAVFPQLAPVVERLLLRDPEARYQQAADVLRDLLEVRARAYEAADTATFLALLEQVGDPDAAGLSLPSMGRVQSSSDGRWVALAARVTSSTEPTVLADARAGSGQLAVAPVEGERPSTRPPLPPSMIEGTRGQAESGPDEESPSGTQSMMMPHAGGARRRLTPLVFAATGVMAVALVGVLVMRGMYADAPPVERSPVASVDIAGLDLGEIELPTPEPASVSVPDLPAQAARPDRAAVVEAEPPVERGAVEPGLPTPEPAPAAEPDVTAEIVALPTEEVAATPEPVVVAEPSVSTVAPPTRGCLVLTSRPVGAEVWVDGSRTGLRALSSSSRGRLHTIGMGSGDQPAASTEVEIVAGQGVRVDCELVVSKRCTASAAEFAACEP